MYIVSRTDNNNINYGLFEILISLHDGKHFICTRSFMDIHVWINSMHCIGVISPDPNWVICMAVN